MEEVKSNSGMWGMGGWNAFNTLLGAAGLATGATALGVKANASHFNRCGECWGSYNNGCNGGCGGYGVAIVDPIVNRYELQQSQRISELESEKVTDAKILEVYKASALSDQRQDEKFAQLTKDLTDYIIANNRDVDARFANVDKSIAVNSQAVSDNFNFLNYKIDNNQREMFAYVDCKTLPLEKKLPLSSICPKPLAGSTPIVANPQVITTTSATTNGEVQLNSLKVASTSK